MLNRRGLTTAPADLLHQRYTAVTTP